MSIAAHASSWIAFASLCLLVLGPAGAFLRILPPGLAFGLFSLALGPGGALSLLLGLVGMLRTRAASGRTGASQAWGGSVVGLFLVLGTVVLVAYASRVPPIHDITTDPDDPPEFEAILELPANEGRDLSYPNGAPDTAAQQQAAYPDLTTVERDESPTVLFARVLEAIDDLGWTVVATQSAFGQIEASDTSRLFRFVDDVVVRIRPWNNGSQLDVRSTSRIGRSDLGANAKRIRALLAKLDE